MSIETEKHSSSSLIRTLHHRHYPRLKHIHLLLCVAELLHVPTQSVQLERHTIATHLEESLHRLHEPRRTTDEHECLGGRRGKVCLYELL